ncbi:unnamed protein product [Heligmosomoides polygyrus]|uniref:Beclin-1-like protein n=1 Tax=Heligmosomoides polygyrus TaxID=6339 RepID=A0A183FUB8_HELPZ|nr:unnamed protein product [Heligmosomoides polygyrus]
MPLSVVFPSHGPAFNTVTRYWLYDCVIQFEDVSRATSTIAREIDVEADTVSEELAIIEESYPRMLATLQKFKRDLLLLREETCNLRSRYENFVTSFMDQLRKHCPSLIPQLQALSRKQMQLRRLKWMSRGRELLSLCRAEMKNNHYCRAFSNQITAIASILNLVYLIAEHNEEGTGYDEVYRMLLDPFGTRFAFHFYGDRKTNDIWKPQWYLSQTLNWIQVNLPFFVTIMENFPKRSVSVI